MNVVNEISFFKYFIVNSIIIFVVMVVTFGILFFCYIQLRKRSAITIHGVFFKWWIITFFVGLIFCIASIIFTFKTANLWFLKNRNVPISYYGKCTIDLILICLSLFFYAVSWILYCHKYQMAIGFDWQKMLFPINKAIYYEGSTINYWNLNNLFLKIDINGDSVDIKSKKMVKKWKKVIDFYYFAELNENADFKKMYLMVGYAGFVFKNTFLQSNGYFATRKSIVKPLRNKIFLVNCLWSLVAINCVLLAIIFVLGVTQQPASQWELVVYNDEMQYSLNLRSLIVWLAFFNIFVALLALCDAIVLGVLEFLLIKSNLKKRRMVFSLVILFGTVFSFFVSLYFLLGIIEDVTYQSIIAHGGNIITLNRPLNDLLMWMKTDYLMVDGWLFLSDVVITFILVLMCLWLHVDRCNWKKQAKMMI